MTAGINYSRKTDRFVDLSRNIANSWGPGCSIGSTEIRYDSIRYDMAPGQGPHEQTVTLPSLEPRIEISCYSL